MNLKETFGDKYRVTEEECAEGRDDPWHYEIKGGRGVVYPFGGRLLAVELTHNPRVAKQLLSDGYELYRDGDHEQTFLVPADDLHGLARLLRLPIRRRLKPEQKADCIARLRAHQKKASEPKGKQDGGGPAD